MKNKFSTSWNSSSKARKQRKYRINAPLHLRQRFMSANLSKELRKSYGRRSLEVRKDDLVKVITGKYKGKRGKVTGVDIKRERVAIEGLQISKKDGSKANVHFHPSNLQITELNKDDRKRIEKKQAEKQVQDKKAK